MIPAMLALDINPDFRLDTIPFSRILDVIAEMVSDVILNMLFRPLSSFWQIFHSNISSRSSKL